MEGRNAFLRSVRHPHPNWPHIIASDHGAAFACIMSWCTLMAMTRPPHESPASRIPGTQHTHGEPEPVLLFDGECGLCTTLARFALAQTSGGARLHAAPLQGPSAQALCLRAGLPTENFDSLVFIRDLHHPEAGHALRTDGVVALTRLFGPGWRIASTMLAWLPAPWRDAGYRVVARLRKKIRGAPRPLPRPPPEWADRLLP